LRRDDQLANLDARLTAHLDVMIRVAAALVGSADAEDAAQEAASRAWRSWDALRDAEAVRSWLLRITINACHDWLCGRFGARVRRTKSLDAEGADVATLDLDPSRMRHAAALDLRSAMNRLRSRYVWRSRCAATPTPTPQRSVRRLPFHRRRRGHASVARLGFSRAPSRLIHACAPLPSQGSQSDE
jgi:hypothetical protein